MSEGGSESELSTKNSPENGFISRPERELKYLRNPDSAEFVCKLPPPRERQAFADGCPVAFVYRRIPLWFPGYIDRLLVPDRIERTLRTAFGGGRFILKVKQGRQGLTTRVLDLVGEPIPCEAEDASQQTVTDYLNALASSKEFCRHYNKLSHRLSSSPDWLRAFLRRMGFPLRRERTPADGKPYHFPLLDG